MKIHDDAKSDIVFFIFVVIAVIVMLAVAA